jgi:biopolymer transport protein ExbD
MINGPSSRRRLSREETDLNLIPIMNLFIVIVPMLITMWVSVQMAMLAIDISSGTASSVSNQKIKLKKIEVGLFKNDIQVKVQGDKNVLHIPVIDSLTVPRKYDMFALDRKLAEIHKRYPEQKGITLVPAPDVKYNTLLKAIDISKFNGFENIEYSISSVKTFVKK